MATRQRTIRQPLARARALSGPTALAGLLAAGVALRVWVMVAYRPAVLENPDSGRYLYWAHEAPDPLGSAFSPPGYSVFLELGRLLSPRLEVTIALQHLLGVLSAILLYLAVRRFGFPRWAAVIPAAVVLLAGDQLYLEHALLSESVFTVLLAAALYSAARTIGDEPRGRLWLASAGALLALATLVRSIGLVVVAVVAAWALLAWAGSPRERLIRAGAVLLPAAGLLLAYAGLAAAVDSRAGLGDVSGWHLYARVAPFADCDRFEPPTATRRLCQSAASETRPGPSFYLADPRSPAQRAFGGPPSRDDRLGDFARAAIAGQPLSYLRAVGDDVLRYLEPNPSSDRPYSGGGYSAIAFEGRDRRTAARVAAQARRTYSGVDPRVSEVDALGAYQDVVRTGPWLTIVFLLLAAGGFVAARGAGHRTGDPETAVRSDEPGDRARAGIALFGLSALALMLVPVATVAFSTRFAVPAAGSLAAAGAIGAAALVARLGERRASRATSP